MTISPAPALKKELTRTFPDTKFSITTKTSSISVNCITVKWDVPVYSSATEKTVREIAEKYESIERRGNSIDNTAWATGYSVSFAPKYSNERKDWARQATEIHKIVDAVWDITYDVFKQADNKINWEATDQYHQYLRDGIFCDLVDETGNQSSAKISYYKDIKIQSKTFLSESLELELISPATTSPKQISLETDREKCVRVAKEICPAMFETTSIVESVSTAQCLFKVGDRIQHNDKGTARVIWVGKQEIKVENNSNKFFFLNIKSFNKKGWEIIESSTVPISPAALETLKTRPETVELELQVLTLNSLVTTNRYRIKVTDVRTETVTGRLLDDQDRLILEYGHPVYVCVRKSEILSLSKQPQPEPQTLAPAEPKTNLIPFPSFKQTEPQSATQPQSDDGDNFYLKSYQAWVNKLVAQGEYGKIKSFEEWYAIAIEVM